MDMYTRDVVNKLLYHETEEVQKLVHEELEAIENLNNRINIKGISESIIASTIVRIRKEVTGSYAPKR